MSIGLEEKAEPLWGQTGSLAICVLSTRWRANDGDSVAGSLGLLQFCLSCMAESLQNRKVRVWAFGGLSAEVAFKRLRIFLNLVTDYTGSETDSGLCQHSRLNPLATKQYLPLPMPTRGRSMFYPRGLIYSGCKWNHTMGELCVWTPIYALVGSGRSPQWPGWEIFPSLGVYLPRRLWPWRTLFSVSSQWWGEHSFLCALPKVTYWFTPGQRQQYPLTRDCKFNKVFSKSISSV